MRETLYDRLRPFKPYDMVLAMVVLLMVVHRMSIHYKALLLPAGVLVIYLAHVAQQFVRVPTPRWQALLLVALNTAFIIFVVEDPGVRPFRLALYILNCAFATLAFDEVIGIIVALACCIVESHADVTLPAPLYPIFDWGLLFSFLLSVTAVLARVNRLHEGAIVDAVTGLRNHRFFQIRMREELHRSDRFARPTSLLIGDLDNFKRVNDELGHAFGDQVLHRVGEALMRCARSSDIVCRYGGEEFALILPETTAEDAAIVAERARAFIERQQHAPGVQLTISIGIASYPGDALDADALVHAADTAMYEAKRAGKNRVVGPPPKETSSVIVPVEGA